jgi:hypothetical protein
MSSVRLAQELLATSSADESTARRVLEAAFGDDPRLLYEHGAWALSTPVPAQRVAEPDRALLFIEGGRELRSEPYRLTGVAALRLRDDDVLSACGGDVAPGPSGRRLRRTVLAILDGAVPIVHDPPGSLRALEEWLDEPLTAPISLRRLAQARLGCPSGHNLEELAARLGLTWRETDDPLELADTLMGCLESLRRPGERLLDLRVELGDGSTPIDWSRYAFDRDFLRQVPRAAGTYRFFDARDNLLYVGKSKNLNRRLSSYFRESGHRSARVQKLLDALHRIEYEAVGSDLEAVLREAEAIRRDRPERNVQRRVAPRAGRAGRLRSILILEPAEPPLVLRAYLIRQGRLIERVGIGPRGGGLRRIRRVLEDRFFSAPSGPTPAEGPDLDVELVVRWLAENRDRAVAFDPTELSDPQEVVDRLRWFLSQGTPFDPEEGPVFPR